MAILDVVAVVSRVQTPTLKVSDFLVRERWICCVEGHPARDLVA